MNKLIMYSQPGCRPCRAAENKLDAEGIAYQKVDVSEDEEARERLRRAGLQSTPIFGFAGELHTIVALRDIIQTIKEQAA